MTSSTNITGDIKRRLRLRKINFKNLSLEWKRNSGGSCEYAKNVHTKLRLNESFTDIKSNVENTNGFFKNLSKKLSVKNFCGSKRKITVDSNNCLDLDSSNSMKNFIETPFLLNSDKHNVETKNNIGEVVLNLINNSNGLFHNSKYQLNDEYLFSDNYSNFQTNINHNELDVNIIPENLQDQGIGSRNKNISYTKDVNKRQNRDTDNELEHENINDMKCMTNLSHELQKLRKYGWYWGNTSGEVANAALLSEPDGAFLIRDSSDRRHLLTLSFKSAGKLLHARVEHSGGMFSLCSQGESGRFSSVPELIDHSMNFSKSAVFCYSRPRHPGYPAFPVRLTKPVSRFNRVRTLQYLCRFVIRQNTRWDNIQKLPLPKSLRIYIEEGHY